MFGPDPPVTTIRPNPFPAATPQAQTSSLDQAKHAAQRAFFAAAMGQAPAVTQAAPQPPAEARPAVASRTPDPAAERPQRILRPGSLLDIRV